MKQIIKSILEHIGFAIHFLYPQLIVERLSAVKSHIYTGYLKHQFGLWGKGSVIAYKAMALKGLKYISIGKDVQICSGIQLTAWDYYENQKYKPSIIIGNNCNIRENAHITAINKIYIGDNLLTGTNILITDNSHGDITREQMDIHPQLRPLSSKGPVYIGNNVWIGNNVCILPGTSIGDGCIIAANSIVTKNIPAYCVAAGAPAQIIKNLNKNQ